MAEDFDINQFKEIFVSESKEHLGVLNTSLLELEKNPTNTSLVNEIFRVAHTLKGMAATMGFDKVTGLTHSMENVLDKFRSGKLEIKPEMIDVLFDCFDVLELLLEEVGSGADRGIDVQSLIDKLKATADAQVAAPASTSGPAPAVEVKKKEPVKEPAKTAAPADPPQAAQATQAAQAVQQAQGDTSTQTVRVRVEHLDKLMNLVGELVISKARLAQIADERGITELTSVVNEISQFTIELQEGVLKTRMVPVTYIFDRYPRMIRDLSHKLAKEIEFVMTGTEIEIDRMLLDQINEPLVHLLRNAIDHGIEMPEERKKKEKSSCGKITLSCRREKGYVRIEVSDDGKGMNAEYIKQKAIEKGLITSEDGAQMSDSELFMLICHPGFSTAQVITDISGRGVGMDVVKNLVDEFNGKLEIRSKVNQGSAFIVQLPLSLAIIQALLVRVNGDYFAVPLTNVTEITKIEQQNIKTIEKAEVMLLRDEIIPLVKLSKVFNIENRKTDYVVDPYAVIVEINEKKIGLVVDMLIGKQEIVIKTLVGVLRNARSFSGATILGDGRVVLIIDVGSLYGV